MYLFKRFSDIHKGDKLEQFVRDLHTGKLHHNFHHPQAEEPEEPEEPKPTDGEKNAETLADKVEKAVEQKNPNVPDELKKPVEPEHHDEEDDPSKPVPVKSVLKHLKPSNNRYSLVHNEL